MKNIIIYSIVALSAAVISVTSAAKAQSNGWVPVASVDIGVDNRLNGIAANSATDIWAVGTVAPNSDPNLNNTLIEHFNGKSWSVVSSPSVGFSSQLFKVAAKQGKAWAVGYFTDSTTFTPRTLIEAWNGSSWQVVSSPSPGTFGLLYAVSALSPSDVWAVGFDMNSHGVFETLIEHFNGTSWSVVPSPSPGVNGNQLYAVKAISPNSVWAVGQQQGTSDPDQTLIEHWDGATWSVVSGPVTTNRSVVLYSVSGVSDSDVRAVGDSENNVVPSKTLIEDGTNGSWAFQTSPNVGSTENHLNGIAALDNDVAWAVGSYLDPASGALFTLTLRHDDSGWTVVPSPNPGSAVADNSALGDVVALSPTDIWAVGSFAGANGDQTLILHSAMVTTAKVGGHWEDAAMPSKSGTFTATFDATPSDSPTDATVALSRGAQTAYADFACLVRFNSAGKIDARNGDAYAAASAIPYTPGTTYHFRVTVNVATHTYSVFVTPFEGTEVTVGSNFAFRTEQKNVSSLDHWGTVVQTSANGGVGTITVANFETQ